MSWQLDIVLSHCEFFILLLGTYFLWYNTTDLVRDVHIYKCTSEIGSNEQSVKNTIHVVLIKFSVSA